MRLPRALGYGLSLAHEAEAHATVQAASVKLALTHTFVRAVADVVASENRRRQRLAELLAARARDSGLAAGVICTTESPQLTYTDFLNTFAVQARVHDVNVLDAEPVALDLDRGLIEKALYESSRPVIVVPAGHAAF